MTDLKKMHKAIRNLDFETIRSFAEENGDHIPDKPIVFKAAVHKARAAMPSSSKKQAQESKKWLKDHGFLELW